MRKVDQTQIDDCLDPVLKARSAFVWLKKWQKATGVSVILICVYNIFGPFLFLGEEGSSLGTANSFSLGLTVCFVATIIGTFFGAILALLPVKEIPYLLKLPLATLSGILLVNLTYAVHVTVPIVEVLLG